MERPTFEQLQALAPQPRTIEDTGLTRPFLCDLVSKHLAESGGTDLSALSERLALPNPLVEEILNLLRGEGLVEVLSALGASNHLPRYGLTERGRRVALDAMVHDGYLGPAPVPLDDYRRVATAQSIRKQLMKRSEVQAAFAGIVIPLDILDRLGLAVHSGRPIFIYGAPGTGKTYIARRLRQLLGPPVLIPHAILLGDWPVRCFEPGVHVLADQASIKSDVSDGGLFKVGFDARYHLCERPLLAAGGELTLKMLNLTFDTVGRRYEAPLQLQANNGLLLIDDLGRQEMTPTALFNRWIIPLEESVDHLSNFAGQHFTVPFDLSLVLSTNLEPSDIVDRAFLRRIGYKIEFRASTREDYTAIFFQESTRRGLEKNPALLSLLIDELYPNSGMPMLACHPRDLLSLAVDYVSYTDAVMDETAIRWAWDNYNLADTLE